jgi:glycosyltransferase involved in cell wall biosynthesis
MNFYILITPVRNEGKYIEGTINSVLKQTIQPRRWIIVDDGSTDNTGKIIKRYSEKSNFIKSFFLPGVKDRNFGSKVRAFNCGLKFLDIDDFDFIGNLDGDITFQEDYFENILYEFDRNPKLGIAGGKRLDLVNGKFKEIKSSNESVAGGFQLFRRKCYEDIGGYLSLKYGGIDAVAEIDAMRYGWLVKSFEDYILWHHKPTGSASRNRFKYRFEDGIKYYIIGYSPIFYCLRTFSRIKQKPFIIGSILSVLGYFWSYLRRIKRPVSNDFVKFLRKEQIKRLKFFRKSLISS